MLLLEYLSLLQVLLSIKSTTFSIKLNTTTNETATIKEPHKTNNSFQNAALSITFLPSVLPVERKNFYTLKNPLENKSSNLQHEGVLSKVSNKNNCLKEVYENRKRFIENSTITNSKLSLSFCK